MPRPYKKVKPEGDPHKRAGATGVAHGECTGVFAHRRCAPAVFDAAPNKKSPPRDHEMIAERGAGAQPLPGSKGSALGPRRAAGGPVYYSTFSFPSAQCLRQRLT